MHVHQVEQSELQMISLINSFYPLDCNLRYISMDNFIMLENLQELDLSYNVYFDDWICDRLARQFRNSTQLRVLDLSYNPMISERGVETLHKIRSLKRIIITGTQASQFKCLELLKFLFNDINPECEIIH